MLMIRYLDSANNYQINNRSVQVKISNTLYFSGNG
jgi:hypothetical protein